MNFKSTYKLILAGVTLVASVGCNGGSSAGAAPANEAINGLNPAANAVLGKGASVGATCKTSDPSQICLGLKYVAYQSSKGQPVMTSQDAAANIVGINKVWSQCKIGFQIDQFLSVDPKSSNLNFNPANTAEMDDIRKVYGDPNTLLVVTTGSWNRDGSLGSTGANAWTAMPGELLYGAVLESPVATFANIIGHELGHYLNLDHVSDTSDLMNPIIASNSVNLTPSQCTAARASVPAYWQRMVR